MPVIRSVMIGLRLCGIADEPFWPALNGSSTSRTSVRWRWRISVANRSRPAPASAIAFRYWAWRSRATTWVETSSRDKAQALEHGRLELGAVCGVGADGTGQRADRRLLDRALEPAHVALGLERVAGQLQPEGRRLRVDPVRAADADRVHVLARARDERVAVRLRAPSTRIAPACMS